MADKIKVKVLGLRELERKLTQQIPKKAQAKVVNRALRKAAKPMVQTARLRARRGKSNALSIAMSIWQVKKRTKLRNFGSVEFGPRRNNKRAIAAYWDFYAARTPTASDIINGIRHGHLVEWGTKTTPAHPFMRPALDAHGRQTIADFGKILGREIEKEAARGVRQGRRR